MRKNWKKAITLVMAAAMAAGLAGCGNGAKQAEETTAAQTEAAKTEAAKTEAETTAEPAEAEGLTVNTTDPIEISFSWWRFKARSHAGRSRCIHEEVSEYYGKDFLFRMGWLGR